jgi:hypothetical protein
MLRDDGDKENYDAKHLSTFVQRPRALGSRGPIRPQTVDGQSGIQVPKLNLLFINRELQGGRVKSKASESTASYFLSHTGSVWKSKHTSKNVACDYSVSSQTSLESDLSGTRDFKNSLEHMDDDELKRILRRQYKKVSAL